MVWLEEDEVCEEDDEVEEEQEEMGAEEPHSSLQSGQVCRSDSGNEAICGRQVSESQAQFTARAVMTLRYLFGGHIGPVVWCRK